MKTLDNKTVVAVSVLIILFPLGYSVVSSVFSQSTQGSRPFLEKPDEKHGNECVLETEYGLDARFHHMDLLKQLRDDAVRDGKRGGIGFNKCRECHTSRERFCNQCHNAVNLHLDCYRCHYYP